MRILITDCPYFQHLADGYNFYVVSKTPSSFWCQGQIIEKFKERARAEKFLKENLFYEYLKIIPIKDISALRLKHRVNIPLYFVDQS